MWDGYLGAITAFLAAHPTVEANVVIDRFHVARSYRDDFDKLRMQELRRLRRELPEATYQEGPRHALGIAHNMPISMMMVGDAPPFHSAMPAQAPARRANRNFQHGPEPDPRTEVGRKRWAARALLRDSTIN